MSAVIKPESSSAFPSGPLLNADTMAETLSAGEWNVFVYYPEEKLLRLPAPVACRLQSVRELRLDRLTEAPPFVSPENFTRFLALFREIDAGKDAAAENFEASSDSVSYTVTLNVCQRDSTGKPLAVLGRLIPKRVQLAQKAHIALKRISAEGLSREALETIITQGIASQFAAVYFFDLLEGTLTCYRERYSDNKALLRAVHSGSITRETYIDTHVEADFREEVAAFTDPATLEARFRKEDRLSLRYRRTHVGWVRATLIPVLRDARGKLIGVLMTVADTGADPLMPAVSDGVVPDLLKGTLGPDDYRRKLAVPGTADQVCVSVFSIDKLTRIESLIGSAGAGRLLLRAGSLLLAAFRQTEGVYRLEKDLFAAVFRGNADTLWPSLCDRFLGVAAGLQGLLPDGSYVSLSVGLAGSADGLSPVLDTRARKAMKHIQSLGGGGCSLIDPEGRIDRVWRAPHECSPQIVDRTVLIGASMASLLANTDAFAYIKDCTLTYMAGSESFAVRIAGRASAAELTGATDTDLFGEGEFASSRRAADEAFLASGDVRMTSRETYPCAGGETCICQSTRYLLQNPDGSAAGILGISHDITRQVQIEAAASNGLNPALYEALPGIFALVCTVAPQDGRFVPVQIPEHVQPLVRGDSFADFMKRYIDSLVDPDFAQTVSRFTDLSTLCERLADNAQLDCEFRKRNHTHWFRMSFLRTDGSCTGRDALLLFTVNRIDSTSARNQEDNLERKALLENIFANMPGGLVLYRWDGSELHPVYVTPEYKKRYGAAVNTVTGVTDFTFIHPEDRPAYIAAFRNAVTGTMPVFDNTFRVWNANEARHRWVTVHAVARRQTDGSVLVYANYTDVSSQKEQEVRFQYASEHDSLTDLFNRQRVFDQCRELLFRYPEEKWLMLHLDICQFHLYNAFYGEKEGNRLLCHVADLLRSLDGELSLWTCGRIEADVFCLFFKDKGAEQLHRVTDRLLSVKDYRKDFPLRMRLGLYRVSDPKTPVETQLDRASIAAKSRPDGAADGITVFNDKLEADMAAAQSVVNDMHAALENREFELWLQPKVSLRTGRVIAAEGLVRWRHPVKGLISPGLFIPVFESNGFITRLDRYIWEAACQKIADRISSGKEVIPIAVNISRISMYDRTTVSFLKALVTRYGFDPVYLELELTESAYMDDPSEMEHMLDELQRFGFRILIDDFGKGYSSLTSLRSLRADKLKLDMDLLPTSAEDSRGWAMVGAMINMGMHLGMEVVAEGVETQEQATILKALGCPYAQGYYFSRPLPQDEFRAFIEKTSG